MNFLERVFERGIARLLGVTSIVMTWPRWVKRSVVVLADAVLCVLAVWLSFSLRLGEWRLLDWPVVRFTGSLMVVWFPVALYQGVYNAIFRYTGRGAIISLVTAMVIATLPLIYVYMIESYPGVPRTIALIAPLVFLTMMTTLRIVGRYTLIDLFHWRPREIIDPRRTLIYGAGSLGQRLASSFATEADVRLVGYIDDDRGKRRQRLDRHKIWHSSEIKEAISRTGATHVLLAMSGISRSRKREIVDQLGKFDVEVHPVPPMRELLKGDITFDDLRPIEVEDLLGRNPVSPDIKLLRLSVENKRVMVTGAGGSIGSEICRQIMSLHPRELVLVEANEFALYQIGQELMSTHAEMILNGGNSWRPPIVTQRLVNIADTAAVSRLFDELPPQTVYHAAAYKHVHLFEDNVAAGLNNNIVGTYNVASAARQCATERFILISTDKAVRPPNMMGASKRICELILQSFDADDRTAKKTIFAMVRFGNVLGSSGSVVPLFNRQIKEGGPVTVTHRKVTRYFMTIAEAAQLVIQAGGMAEGGEVYVLDMGEPVAIWDLAKSMITLAGLKIKEPGGDGDIEIVEVGLRRGEKLFEELLIGDNPSSTSHPRIFRAREDFLSLEELETVIAQLRQAIANADEDRCRKVMQSLVPTLACAELFDREDCDCERAGKLANNEKTVLPMSYRQ